MGFVEITGTEGTLELPDPNYFDGDLKLWRAGAEEAESIPATGPANGRGMGVLDMARSLRAGVPHRAQGPSPTMWSIPWFQSPSPSKPAPSLASTAPPPYHRCPPGGLGRDGRHPLEHS